MVRTLFGRRERRGIIQIGAADYRQILAERLERTQTGGEFEIGAGLFGRPVMFGGAVHGTAGSTVHHFDSCEPGARTRGGLLNGRLRRRHRVQKGRLMAAPIPRKIVRRERCFLVRNMLLVSSIERRGFIRDDSSARRI